MKCEAQTEQEMREHKVPWIKSIEELTEYIQSLVNREHDYGTSAYSMSLAATAAFNYIAGSLGTTGFQAGCADLDILRRTRSIKGPFKIVNYENALYPQYETNFLPTIDQSTLDWLRNEATEKLKEHTNKKRFETDSELKRKEILFRDFSSPFGGYVSTYYRSVGYSANPEVIKHWKKIASGNLPFGYMYILDKQLTRDAPKLKGEPQTIAPQSYRPPCPRVFGSGRET